MMMLFRGWGLGLGRVFPIATFRSKEGSVSVIGDVHEVYGQLVMRL